MKPRWLILILALIGLLLPAACQSDANQWSADEKDILRGLWIGSLKPLPPDPSNRYVPSLA